MCLFVVGLFTLLLLSTQSIASETCTATNLMPVSNTSILHPRTDNVERRFSDTIDDSFVFELREFPSREIDVFCNSSDSLVCFLLAPDQCMSDDRHVTYALLGNCARVRASYALYARYKLSGAIDEAKRTADIQCGGFLFFFCYSPTSDDGRHWSHFAYFNYRGVYSTDVPKPRHIFDVRPKAKVRLIRCRSRGFGSKVFISEVIRIFFYLMYSIFLEFLFEAHDTNLVLKHLQLAKCAPKIKERVYLNCKLTKL